VLLIDRLGDDDQRRPDQGDLGAVDPLGRDKDERNKEYPDG
jgi:hypothetical protein